MFKMFKNWWNQSRWSLGTRHSHFFRFPKFVLVIISYSPMPIYYWLIFDNLVPTQEEWFKKGLDITTEPDHHNKYIHVLPLTPKKENGNIETCRFLGKWTIKFTRGISIRICKWLWAFTNFWISVENGPPDPLRPQIRIFSGLPTDIRKTHA